MTDPEPTSEEEYLRRELDVSVERLRANPPMGGFGFELMLCGFERDRRANEQMLAEVMEETVAQRALFREKAVAYYAAHPEEQPYWETDSKEQPNVYHTDAPIPRVEGEDRAGEPAQDPAPD